MNFSEYLKNARNKNNLSQEDASELIGVSTNTIQNWEKDTLPKSDFFKDIIKAYNLNLKEFEYLYSKEMFKNVDKDFVDTNIKITEKYPLLKFLFPDKIDFLNNFSFDEEEIELLLHFYIYSRHNKYEKESSLSYLRIYTDLDSMKDLPYTYVGKKGVRNIINLTNKINEKLYYLDMKKDSLEEGTFVFINYLLDNDIKKISLVDLNFYEIVKYLDFEEIWDNKGYTIKYKRYRNTKDGFSEKTITAFEYFKLLFNLLNKENVKYFYVNKYEFDIIDNYELFKDYFVLKEFDNHKEINEKFEKDMEYYEKFGGKPPEKLKVETFYKIIPTELGNNLLNELEKEEYKKALENFFNLGGIEID